VQLCATPADGLRALSVRGDFDPATRTGLVSLRTELGKAGGRVSARLLDDQGRVCAQSSLSAEQDCMLQLPDAQPWSPDAPVRYRLQVAVHAQGDDALIDRYEQPIGLRRIEVAGGELRLNGQPLQLRGFGMHEDFPVLGKGSNAALRVKDFELLRWIGANSFRSSHYAYAEETLDEADRRGLLVISELASVNLDFRRVTPDTLVLHQQMLAAQIARDGGHACVIAWSLTNEPGYLAEPEYRAGSSAYFDALFHSARALDPTRPLTAANVGRNGLDDPMYAHCDFLSLNRYHGWYDMPAQLDRAEAHLRSELQTLWHRFGKPMLLTEFGADAIPGMHASSDQLFTEEFQAAFVETYWRVIASTPGCIGGHVWNFADFRTAQHHRRVQFNFKGVFTRTRDPKLAAWRLKSLWV
jgi:beta-glucuronidase